MCMTTLIKKLAMAAIAGALVVTGVNAEAAATAAPKGKPSLNAPPPQPYIYTVTDYGFDYPAAITSFTGNGNAVPVFNGIFPTVGASSNGNLLAISITPKVPGPYSNFQPSSGGSSTANINLTPLSGPTGTVVAYVVYITNSSSGNCAGHTSSANSVL